MKSVSMTQCGLPFHVRVTNEGEWPAVIFAHGFGSTWTTIAADDCEIEAKRLGRKFVRFEYRFVGDDNHHFKISEWKEDLVSVLNYFPNGPHIIIGSSMGGFAALLAAEEIPEKVKGLLLVSPAVGFLEEFVKRCGMWDAIEKGETLKLPWGTAKTSLNRDSIEEANCLDPLKSAASGDLLSAIACPVIIVHGTDDETVKFKNAELLVEKLKNAGNKSVTLVERIGAQHNIDYDAVPFISTLCAMSAE